MHRPIGPAGITLVYRRFAALHTLLSLYVWQWDRYSHYLFISRLFMNESGSSGGIDVPTKWKIEMYGALGCTDWVHPGVFALSQVAMAE